MNILRWLSVALLLLNGIAACFGGYALVHDPSGAAVQLSPDLLHNTPFATYLIPGIILLVVIGVGNIVVATLAAVNTSQYPKLIAASGCILVGWIAAQILMIRILFFLHYVIGGIGVTLIALGTIQWMMRTPDRRNRTNLNGAS